MKCRVILRKIDKTGDLTDEDFKIMELFKGKKINYRIKAKIDKLGLYIIKEFTIEDEFLTIDDIKKIVQDVKLLGYSPIEINFE